MTDAELIAALGWKSCKRYDDTRGGCAVHPDDGGMWVSGDPWCLNMMNALLGARAGIDLAREGIAVPITTSAGGSMPTVRCCGRQHWRRGGPMTDEELLAALHWKPCRPHPTDPALCDSHNEMFLEGTAICNRRAEDLDAVSDGIHLARQGIAEYLEQTAGNVTKAASIQYQTGARHAFVRAADLARKWQRDD